jgi:uncharacterized protein YndB with AHSA1/START domain
MSLAPLDLDPTLDLVLERVVDVPPEKVWAAWTKPEHIEKWFTPAPWKTSDVVVELRPGGAFKSRMTGPEGQSFENAGCFLEIVENRRLVWTDCLRPGFRPSQAPFFTAVIEIEPHGSGTKYRAIARHADAEGREKHEKMGFHHGWGIALDQLVALMKGR